MDHNLGIASGPGVGNIGLPFTLIVGETPPVVTTPPLLPSGARAKYVPLGTPTDSAMARCTSGVAPCSVLNARRPPDTRLPKRMNADSVPKFVAT